MRRKDIAGALILSALVWSGCANPYGTEYARKEGELIQQWKDRKITRDEYEAGLERLYRTEQAPLGDVLESVVGGSSSDDLSGSRDRGHHP
jgi:hypothetical protein